ARAVDDIHGQALKLAGEQAQLRLQINDMFETLARRSKSLVDQQLGLIENLEFEEKDPRRLDSLFRLDHLAARMRRNGENLLILAGTRARRAQTAPVALGDVLRAAISEVEEYQRVQMGATPEGALSGAVVTDVVHLLAELVDNALRASPPDTVVTFSFARAVDGGVLLEVADRGIGIPADDMRAVNERLASGGEVGPDTARHMGLFVVSRLAKRHGLTVRVRPTFDTARNPGVTVSIHIPNALIVSQATRQETGPQRVISAPPSRLAIPAQASAHAPSPAPSPRNRQDAAAGNGLPQRTPPPSYKPAPSEPSEIKSELSEIKSEPSEIKTASGTSLPRRKPGASGIASKADSGISASAPTPVETPKLPSRRPEASPPESRHPESRHPESRHPMDRPRPPARSPEPQDRSPSAPAAGGGQQPPVRHRYRSNPAKTASFFQSRIDPPPPEVVQRTGGATPIFSGMVSDWLTDPTGAEGAPGVWESAADAGWSAVERVSAIPVEVDPEIGLPKRRPGDRLLPGTVEGAQNTGTLRRVRDPETIRANLSRHQQGVRDGRATRLAERNSIEGDR
ncbi:MAG: ATP-binding protein, partial [Rhodococcus sp. (in: high G+C Gram-positive bacteria)]|uniref:sensor histidine kinase n=1 Tax=Rhodococcus sp. TaxID=1831 RepID=UPI003BB1BFF4